MAFMVSRLSQRLKRRNHRSIGKSEHRDIGTAFLSEAKSDFPISRSPDGIAFDYCLRPSNLQLRTQLIPTGATPMKRLCLALLLCLTMMLPLSAANDDDTLYGFTATGSRAERDWEAKFRAIPDPKI